MNGEVKYFFMGVGSRDGGVRVDVNGGWKFFEN